MKTYLIIAASLAVASAQAGPLIKEQVAADAKWLVHVDVDAFLESQIGSFIGREILDRKLQSMTAALRKQFDVDLDWRKIHSLTAYGADFKTPAKANGVLIVKSSLELTNSLETIIDRLAAAQAGNDSGPVKKVQEEPFPIYSANNEVFGAPGGEDLFLLSRSREQLEKARGVLMRQAANMTSAKSFPDLPERPSGFLVLAVADASVVGAKLPPQARVLQEAQGGQIIAGEKSDNVFVRAALSAKDAGVATQLQQALQGVIAVAMLSQPDNPDLQHLAQSAKVSGADKTVTLDVEMPVSDLIAKVSSTHQKNRKQAPTKP